MKAIALQFARFGAVGLIGLIIDVVVFNLLRTTVLAPEALHEGPVVAKVISTTLAILANWMGNRYWTFRRTGQRRMLREGLEFAIVSLGGMAITLGCLWVSHYALGFTSVLADNVASNVVGLALGTAFRFTFYRSWVFAPRAAAPLVTAPQSRLSGPTERPIRPAGFAPLGRLQTIAPVEDRAVAHD